MTVEQLQKEMREAEVKITEVIQSLEHDGVIFKDLDVDRIEITHKDSGQRPVYMYKVYIRTELTSNS